MPGDPELVEEFAASLKPPILGEIFKKMVDEMQLAGELGSLLKIEKSIAKAINEAEATHLQGDLFTGKIQSQTFWNTADDMILTALARFAKSAAGNAGIQRRLFAEDAEQGVAFVELMRKRFDIVLMNPPFGALVKSVKRFVSRLYPKSKNDIYGCFLDRSSDLVVTKGSVGAITSRTWMFLPRRTEIRVDVIDAQFDIHVLADLGHSVLDSAMVETCAFILDRKKTIGHEAIFIRAIETPTEEKSILLGRVNCADRINKTFTQYQAAFQNLPGAPLAYWLPTPLFKKLSGTEHLGDSLSVRPGLTTRDNGRFLRAPWEIPHKNIGNKWVWFAKGGAYAPYYFDTQLVLNYTADGRELKAWIEGLGESITTFIANQNSYFKPGLTYPRVTDKGFNVRVLPAGHAFSEKGISIQ